VPNSSAAQRRCCRARRRPAWSPSNLHQAILSHTGARQGYLLAHARALQRAVVATPLAAIPVAVLQGHCRNPAARKAELQGVPCCGNNRSYKLSVLLAAVLADGLPPESRPREGMRPHHSRAPGAPAQQPDSQRSSCIARGHGHEPGGVCGALRHSRSCPSLSAAHQSREPDPSTGTGHNPERSGRGRMDDYHVDNEIGRGKHGSVVYRGRRKRSLEFVAVKSVDKSEAAKVRGCPGAAVQGRRAAGTMSAVPLSRPGRAADPERGLCDAQGQEQQRPCLPRVV